MKMHQSGFSLPSSQSLTNPTQTLIFLLPHFQSQFLHPNSSPILRCCYGANQFPTLVFSSPPNCTSFRRQRCGTQARASGRETPYEVLGVYPSSTTAQIKRAYRKLALKYHPDVNKEPNAQEKFMRIKHAYNTLINSDSRTRYDSRDRKSGFSYSAPVGGQEEDFYGLGDFFKDLQEEYRNWEANASSQGNPKSLWEELAEIGEEFVEFLEKELNISDQDTNVEDSVKDRVGNYGPQNRGSRVENKAKEGSSIEDSIDDIEEALAQLKKELGL